MNARHAAFCGALLAFACAAACRRAPPANVAATVNNRPVTNAELDKQYQQQFASSEPASGDQVMIQKLELLRNLVDNEIMIQRAERLGLMATDSDVELKFNELKAPYTKDGFERQLQNQHMTADDLRKQLRVRLTLEKLFNKEITSRITITDADVANFYNTNKASFNLAEPQVHLAQIMVTAAPDPNVRNLKNDKAQNDEQARKKIETILMRLKQGEDFAMLAQSYSEDPATTANGGDLGFVQESALEKAHPDLRKMVMSLAPNQYSPVIRTQEGYRILKVISKEPAGQRELNDPRVQQTIRDQLLNRKDQLLRAAYYEVARNEAKVANYLAQSIVGEAKK